MIGNILFFIVVALVAILVFLPLVRSSRSIRPSAGKSNGRVLEFEEERQIIIENLKELEFEYQLGKLSEEDYAQQRSRYRSRAMALLKAADAETGDLDSFIEAEVQRLRGVVAVPAAEPSPSTSLCPSCKAPVQPLHRYCPICGTLLNVQAPKPRTPRRATPSEGTAGAPWLAVSGRARMWLLGGTLLAIIFGAGVAALYVTGSQAQKQQRPVGQVVAVDYHALAIGPKSPNAVYLGHHNGVQASNDGGVSWSPMPGLQGDIMAVLADVPEAGAITVAGHGVLARRSPGASTWDPLSHNLPSDDIHAMASHPDRLGAIYAFVAEQGLFLSEDGGNKWRKLSDRVPANVTGIAVAPGQPDMVFLSAINVGVQLSADGGRSWQSANGFVNGALPTTNITALAMDVASGDSFAGAAGNTFRGALYAGAPAGVFKSTDGGGSWLRLPLDTDIMALALGPAGSRTVWAVNSKGQIFRSDNGGVNWGGK